MFRNIVFDIGGVLLTWSPEQHVRNTLDSALNADYFAGVLFRSPEWSELDRGGYTAKELHARYLAKYPEIAEEINLLFENWFDILNPIDENIELVSELKSEGYRLYILSNFVREAFEAMRRRYSFFDLFDGFVVSCYVHSIKPEKEMFLYLLDSCDLDARECLFIDDEKENVEAAKEVGIEAIGYLTPKQLRLELHKRHIL